RHGQRGTPGRGERPMTIARVMILTLLASGCLSLIGACDRPADPTGMQTEEEAATNPNIVAIPASVRTNLGISFVAVERRRIEKTLRVPGRFEYLPTARREYRTML